MSSGWREGSPAVPIELHHRPRYFIQHMMSSDVKSQDITADMVHVDVSQQRFRVRSLVTDKWHCVNIGDENTVPTCDCRHYIKTRLPCKHFLAVFHHSADVSFSSLPSHYRDHPLFVVDDECTSLQYTVDTEARTTAHASVDVLTVLAEEEEDDVVMVPSSGHLARECRELAASIVNFTYDVQSVDVLAKLKTALAEAVEMLGSSCPTSGGLPLRADAMSASRDQDDTVSADDDSTLLAEPQKQKRKKPQLQPMRSGRKQPAVGHQAAKRAKIEKHVRFTEGDASRKITEFFAGDTVKPEESTVEEYESPLLKLLSMPDFVHRATMANVTKCCARSSFMPCCRVTPKKAT